MKCEEFLPWLTSGHAARIAAARQHALHCASCQAAAAMLNDIEGDLTAGEPLPTNMRQAWLSVAESPPVSLPKQAQRAVNRRPLWFAVIAASVLAAAAAWALWQGRTPKQADQSRPKETRSVRLADGFDQRHVSPIVVVPVDPAIDYSQLGGELASLQKTFAQVTADAERLAVKEALDRVLVDHQRIFAAMDPR